MTFEMAPARGLAGERRNGEIVTYADGVQRHFVTSIGTVETASVNRRPSCGISLSIDAVRMPASMEAHASVIPLTGDRSAVHKRLPIWCGTGIEIRRTTETAGPVMSSCQWDRISGDFRSPPVAWCALSLRRKARWRRSFLLSRSVAESLGLRAELYDILGWSLPSLYNVDVIPCDRVSVGEERFEGDGIPAYEPPGASQLGWLVPWGSRAAVVSGGSAACRAKGAGG